ncbi:hypothetical protein MJO28_010512 [Puccinia striiformis f. sp. tritici]|uniref:Secreted protein n=4 Tax=Puccinia striiformis TaxID=27350 RepID=A0A0L0V308_9BASI|nr:hypothetical protein Pst134EA_019319 [Puccinia striiformis f. sp. tritici]KAI9623537.1 hypothetical protein KEM48_009432 [Puccinia striiformis f. sp. tritici PST-130]KNE93667.1 hypothetical protein PSTG_12950 [Puccinia striiformis f. sp. tritici PST-78]POW16517.1 hypothetical protein PSTT_01286 [Puccinia striiformis]KAH9449394.1 hypothetical protein Pst134EB_020218 [Puccinia striiformis f. sp. tritici]KAH9459165.1 hypothetical protein Pst134EA_019319 [Puccinia striiformis f. sp. tritici]
MKFATHTPSGSMLLILLGSLATFLHAYQTGFKTCTPDVLAKYPAIYCSDNPDLAGNVENFPTDQRHDFNAKGPVFTCDYHCIPQCCEGSPGKELIVPHVCTNATDFKPGPTHKQYNLQETN